MDRKNLFNIPGEEFQFILSTFSSLILKLNSPSGISFGLYFTVQLDYWFTEITGTLDSQSAESWPMIRPACTVPLDSWLAEITGTLDSQSAESWSIIRPVLCCLTVDSWKSLVRWTLSLRRVLIKEPVRAKNPRTVLYRQTLQWTVLYRPWRNKWSGPGGWIWFTPLTRDVNVSFFLWSNSSFFVAPLKKKLCFVSFLFEIKKQKNLS